MFCVVVVAGLATGCGNSSVICADTTKTLEGFAATAKALPPSDTARWRRAIIDVANRLDALARRADDDELAKALAETAAAYRAAAGGVARGDTSRLSAVIRDQPQRLDSACR
jgi:hypothetical protein